MAPFQETMFTRYPLFTILCGGYFVWLVTDTLGPNVGQSFAAQFDESRSALNVGRIVGGAVGFLGSVGALLAFANRKTD